VSVTFFILLTIGWDDKISYCILNAKRLLMLTNRCHSQSY